MPFFIWKQLDSYENYQRLCIRWNIISQVKSRDMIFPLGITEQWRLQWHLLLAHLFSSILWDIATCLKLEILLITLPSRLPLTHFNYMVTIWNLWTWIIAFGLMNWILGFALFCKVIPYYVSTSALFIGVHSILVSYNWSLVWLSGPPERSPGLFRPFVESTVTLRGPRLCCSSGHRWNVMVEAPNLHSKFDRDNVMTCTRDM